MKNLNVFNSNLTDGKNKRINKGKKLYLIGITSLSLALTSLTGCSNKNDNESSATYESPVIDTTTDVLANNAIDKANNLLAKCENIEMTDELEALVKAVNSKKAELSLLLKGYSTTGEVSGITKIDAIKVCIEELEEACNKLTDYLFARVINNNSSITPTPSEKPADQTEHGKKQDNQKPSQTTQPSQTPSATQTPAATTQPTQAPVSTTAPQVISSPAPITLDIPVWTPGPSTTTPAPTQTPAPSATETPAPTQTPSSTPAPITLDIPNITEEELDQLINNSSSTNGQIGNTTGDVNPNNIYQGSDGDYYVSETPVPTQTPAPQNNEPEFTIPEGAYTVDGYVWASYDEYIGWIDEGCPEIQMDENGICYKSSRHR